MTATSKPRLHSLEVASLTASPHNPRKRIDETQLHELVASIRTLGILDPIIVRPTGLSTYEIVAGHRRVQAAELAGLTSVPAIVRDLDTTGAVEVALVENIQRADIPSDRRGADLRDLCKPTGRGLLPPHPRISTR